MAARKDVATLGAGWNQTLFDYALAVRALWQLPLSNPNSWRFLGAMHGFNAALWINKGVVSGANSVPPGFENSPYINQCQHSSWYFLPWHRGYLAAFEAIIAAKVRELTGRDWALPYWNYLNGENPNARRLPEAFAADNMPDGSPNPLKFYGQNLRYRHPTVTGIPALPSDLFSLDAMEDEDVFALDRIGVFGGGIIGGFDQFGGIAGHLELNPHNIVHGVMGVNPNNRNDLYLIGNPYTAGLDPLFWLHHCNIDRLWEAWMLTPGKQMTNDQRWRDGPSDRRFVVPDVGDGKPGINFSARDTLAGGKFHPTYDDLKKGTGVVPGGPMVGRVGMGPSNLQQVDLIGANSDSVSVGLLPLVTKVELEPDAAADGVATMGANEVGQKISRLYLVLESVRGDVGSALMDVYINVPEGAKPQDHPECKAGSVALFGINVASEPDGPHGGNGLSYPIDITNIAQRLQKQDRLDLSKLNVTLVMNEQYSGDAPVSVGRVSVLKRSGVVPG